jgi:diaminopimelate epimerase
MGGRIAFTKMEGLGNDYVYIDLFETSLEGVDLPTLARDVSDRHFGIGSDGLVLIGPSEFAHCRMRMFNSDGSESEMCGNAVRCIAKLMYDAGRHDEGRISIETLAGTINARIMEDIGTHAQVEVLMGVPRLSGPEIPVGSDADRVIGTPLETGGVTWYATCVSMGNPHCVLFVDEATDDLVHTVGPALETHEFFPNRTNVEFVEVVDRTHLRMRVWERGAGETLACGTGASASLVAGVLNDVCDRTVRMDLLGGSLEIEWCDDGNIKIVGPAVIVFKGEYYHEGK